VREVWDFEQGTFRGSIPQPKETYNVMSHSNEYGLVIGETTHGGLENLESNGILDYGSLIMITLQRSKTAREAIKTIYELTSKYGYGSTGEGFSISDGEESWYMELIGKGNVSKGIVFVALKVPDGYVVANANQARITTFLPCDDPNTCMMAPDTYSFAVENGLFNGTKEDFSFSDVYDPLTVTGARFCEARVWYMYSRIANPEDFNSSYYLPYAQGFNLTRRMPLWVRPKEPITRDIVHELLSSKYENSWLDPSNDVSSGAEHSPYRYNGLTWTIGNTTFVNERIVGTQFTAWHFVAEIDSKRPSSTRALLFWGSDDHAWSPKIPLFGGASEVHIAYDDKNCSARLRCRRQHGLPGSMMSFSWDTAYWTNSAVARLVYQDVDRASAIVHKAQKCFDRYVDSAVKETLKLYDIAPAEIILNSLAVRTGAEANRRWRDLWEVLMVTLQDGLTASIDESNLLCGCKKTSPTYDETWLSTVANNTGARYRLPDSSCAWIDPDGHCHSGKPPLLEAEEGGGSHHNNVPIRKVDVPGVLM